MRTLYVCTTCRTNATLRALLRLYHSAEAVRNGMPQQSHRRSPIPIRRIPGQVARPANPDALQLWKNFRFKTDPTVDSRYVSAARLRFKQLFHAVLEEWCLRPRPALPTPIALIRKAEKLQIPGLSYYVDALWPLLVAIARRRFEFHQHSNAPDLEVLEDQLARVWHRLIQTSLSHYLIIRDDTLPLDWSMLSSIDQFDQPSKVRKGNRLMHFRECWSSIFPNRQLSAKEWKTVASALMATLGLFGRTSASTSSQPLLQFLEFVACRLHSEEHMQGASMELSKREVAPKPLMCLVREARIRAVINPAFENRTQESHLKYCPEYRRKLLMEYFLSSLEYARAQSQPKQLEQAFADLLNTYEASENSHYITADVQDRKALVISTLYQALIRMTFETRGPQAVRSILDTMTARGIKLTLFHWTEVLYGAGRCKDLQLVHWAWAAMLGAGIKPDTPAWSARVYALMRCGKFNDGMQALVKIGFQWQEAKANAYSKADLDYILKHGTPTAPKPTTRTLTSALAGLPSHSECSTHKRVLDWATLHDIPLDIFGFNQLLHLCLSEGKIGHAMTLVDTLHRRNLLPDSATFSILFDAALKHSSVPAPKLFAKAIETLDLMTEHDVQPNSHVFNTVIARLLKIKDGFPAACVILDYMAKQGIRPTVHTNTALAQYHFSCSEPDLNAIHTLWNPVPPGADAWFFSTLTEGYARMGRTVEVMQVVRCMEKRGIDVGISRRRVGVCSEGFDEMVSAGRSVGPGESCA